MTTSGEPGWHEDPHDSNAERYWDGQGWTPHRQRKPISRPTPPRVTPTQSPPSGPPPPRWGQQPNQQWGPPAPQWGHQTPPWQQQTPPRSSRWVWIGIGAACALTVLVVTVIALSSHSDSGNTSRESTAGSISGGWEQWTESVCKTGTFVDGHAPPDAERGAWCLPKTGGGAITIGQYDSDYKMRNAIAMLRMKYYASARTSDGTVWMFAVMAGDESILEPLAQFGFTINTASSR
jgi:hypothetical protein